MATYSQIVTARAIETQGVWALSAAFNGGGKTKTEHATQITTVSTARSDKDIAAGAVVAAGNTVRTEHDFFKLMNVPIAQRLDSEVADADPLQKRVDQADDIQPVSEADIERRTELTIVIWKEVNTARAVLPAPLPALVVRGLTVAQYEARYLLLPAKKITRDEKDGLLTSKRSGEKRETRKLDVWNKNLHQAWKSEHPAGTELGDALSQVHTPEGTPVPGILEITGTSQTGLSLAISYDPESGEHATVLELLYKVVGVHDEWQRVPADKVAGNTIGPFLQGQVVLVGTDVGNSRDFSELSPVQEVTLGPPV